jgi:hypothetical protein
MSLILERSKRPDSSWLVVLTFLAGLALGALAMERYLARADQRTMELRVMHDTQQLREYQASEDLEAPAHAERAARQNVRRIGGR